MKKIFPIIAILIMSLLLCGCREREDLIPEKLGEPDGLWLYRGTERMRTDGSERELLFDKVELDGIVYTTDEFEVPYHLYCTDTKTIFFVLTIGENDYLYCYNYDEKWGKQLSDACESGGYHPYYICCGLHCSESYVCFESLHLQEKETVTRLFLRDGTPVCEGLTNFEFSQDILYKIEQSEEGNTLTWWKEGGLHTLSIPAWEGYADDFYDGGLFYHFTEDGQGLAVDTDTEEVFSIPYEGSYDDSGTHNGILWFVTREKSHNADDFVTNWDYYNRLYRFTPAGCEPVYTFEHEKLARIDVTDEAVYLGWYGEGFSTTYQKYDIAEKTLKESKQYFPETESTFTCGEYTFWVGYEIYGWSGRCYYLYRQRGDTVDIMQYIFNDDPNFGKFDLYFDDICNF